MTLVQLRDLLARFTADPALIPTADLRAALSAVRQLAAAAAVTLDELRELRTIRDAFTAETEQRDAAEAERADLLGDLTADPDDTADPDPEPDDPPADPEPATPPASDPDPDPGPEPGPDLPHADQEATGRRIPLGAGTPRTTGPRGRQQHTTITGRLLASRDVNVQGATHRADTELADHDALYGALAVAAQSGFTGRRDVARVEYTYPQDRQVPPGADPAHATRIVRDAQRDFRRQRGLRTRRAAEFAAGGLCAPPDVRYDIPVVGSTARPVADSLLNVQAPHGRLQYRPAINGAAAGLDAATGFWTVQDDIDANTAGAPDPTKTCLAPDCPNPTTCSIEAVYYCLEYPNMTAQFDPDWVRAMDEAARVGGARKRENRLLASMRAGSTSLTTAATLGATRNFFANLHRVIAMIRSVYRMDEQTEPLDMLAPAWLGELIGADLVNQMATSNMDYFGVGPGLVAEWAGRRNVNMTWHLDGLGSQVGPPAVAAQSYSYPAAGTPVPGFPDTVELFLYGSGDWGRLSGQALNIGVVRDSALNARNKFQVFNEEYESACYLGPATGGPRSFRLIMTLQPTGISAGVASPALAASTES
ncbi:MAG: major capsid protein [Phycicoccus sp.]